MATKQWVVIECFLLQVIVGIIAAVGEPSFTASHHEIQADISASICSFAFCSSDEYYSVFRERDGSPANATSTFAL